MITIKLKVKKLNQVVIISSSQRLRMINKVSLPFRMRVPKNYLVHKQAERDIKTNYGQGVGDMLAHECYGVAMANETNGQMTACLLAILTMYQRIQTVQSLDNKT